MENLSDKELIRQGRYIEALGDNYDPNPYLVEIALEGFDALVENERVWLNLVREWAKENHPEHNGMTRSEYYSDPRFLELKNKANEIAPLTILKRKGGCKQDLIDWAENIEKKYTNCYQMWTNTNHEWL